MKRTSDSNRKGWTESISLHLDLDGAWDSLAVGLPALDLHEWGPRLRYIAPTRLIEQFDHELEGKLSPFLLLGSGDFHHLSGLWVRRAARTVDSLILVSFDNHPDWDIRPPRWGCGGWIKRALELPNLKRAGVWGCGNFELRFPARLFASRDSRLEIHAWAERQPPAVQRRFNCMNRDNWRSRFEKFATSLAGAKVYITVDLDCLRAGGSVTNWENGLFTADDLAWAIGQIRANGELIAGDVCGAYSPQKYARWTQRFAAKWDHPNLPLTSLADARRINSGALNVIWPALTIGG